MVKNVLFSAAQRIGLKIPPKVNVPSKYRIITHSPHIMSRCLENRNLEVLGYYQMCAAHDDSGFRMFRTSVVFISRNTYGRYPTEEDVDKMTNACFISCIDPEVGNIGFYGY